MTNIYSPLDAMVNTVMTGSTALVSELGGTFIYRNQAPDGQPLPYVVWNWQSNIDEQVTPSEMWNNILNARVFAATPAQAKRVDGMIDGLFNKQTLSVTGWTSFYSARELAFTQTNVEPSGARVEVIGGFYRIRIGQ